LSRGLFVKLSTLLTMAAMVAAGPAEGPSHVDSMELGESAGLAMYEGSPVDEVVTRVLEALMGEEVPSEEDFDKGFWSGFGMNNDLSGESRDVIEDLHVKPGKKALSELKNKLTKAGVYFG
jgi:hypothetical protein